jgi:4-amino-4-deoxy-L-arabinose transferase-like glycosyltransferase
MELKKVRHRTIVNGEFKREGTLYARTLKNQSGPKLAKGLRLSLSRNKYGLSALLLIALAVGLRLLLTAQGWPTTNSDEGTFGIMAMHIAYRGGHPIFLNGSNYMGALEAYLGAASFRLFGVSLPALRLGVILLYIFFLTSMYLLTSLLYTKKLALFVLVLLCLGSNAMFLRELYATGGSTQTLFFGSLAFLLATWLSLTREQQVPHAGDRWRRLAAYTVWGLAVGLGIWSDMVVLPFFMLSALLLLLFCWRDLLSWAPLCLLLGFSVGVLPLIAYNLHAAPGQDSFSTFAGLFHGSHVQSASSLAQILRGIKLTQGINGTLSMSLPTATGDPSCPVPAVEFPSDASPHSAQCALLHRVWSAGYILLWTLSVLLTLGALRRLRTRSQAGIGGERRELVRHSARLCLLASAAVAVISYTVRGCQEITLLIEMSRGEMV